MQGGRAGGSAQGNRRRVMGLGSTNTAYLIGTTGVASPGGVTRWSWGPYRALRGCVNSVGFLPDECLMPYLDLAGFRSATEYTITLQDVALQLRFPIDGNVVMGVSLIFRPAAFYYDLLGCSPNEEKF
ncbi:hypothetical protein PVK06_026984 [Gossypium arboreum]|uniref:Uncharacterized protein n=1 Tax=Gossypium arboreum TaxID=29729 RepID=A0ABR0P1M3_GOSAR|nr:hypothetical protein PVK06_026984 [Gossypium arboreum]